MDANTNDFLGQLTVTCINPSLSSLALLSRSPLLLSSDLDPLASSTTPDWNPTQLKSSTVAI
jgi:hypothetical protein